mmetsp:Transcript_17105/g.64787  ORF Transcript_17105/g.64787 Transcript_17105/m.64787 type:complete len:363 (-) Transcript_17105:152-1240(-)
MLASASSEGETAPNWARGRDAAGSSVPSGTPSPPPSGSVGPSGATSPWPPAAAQWVAVSEALDVRPAGSSAQSMQPAAMSIAEHAPEHTTPPLSTGAACDASGRTLRELSPRAGSLLAALWSNSAEPGSVVAPSSRCSTSSRLLGPALGQPPAGGGTSTDTTSCSPAPRGCSAETAAVPPFDAAARGTPPMVPASLTLAEPVAAVGKPATLPTATCMRRAISAGSSCALDAGAPVPAAGATTTGTSIRIPQVASPTPGAVEQMPHASRAAGASQQRPPESSTSHSATDSSSLASGSFANPRMRSVAAPIAPAPAHPWASNTRRRPCPMIWLPAATLRPSNVATPSCALEACGVADPSDPAVA